VGSKSKELVEEKELSNLYIDLSENILQKISFDSSLEDHQNQLLFLICIENSLNHLADNIYKIFSSEIDNIDNLSFKYRWIKLQEAPAIKNLIQKELDPDGLIYLIEDAKIKIIKNDTNLITTNYSNNLKKYSLILNKYKMFTELLRKLLDEC
tara:strand:- start:4766 stop:5224 length:459 start_codon:yes stop_codon:yes gene_type:complete